MFGEYCEFYEKTDCFVLGEIRLKLLYPNIND